MQPLIGIELFGKNICDQDPPMNSGTNRFDMSLKCIGVALLLAALAGCSSQSASTLPSFNVVSPFKQSTRSAEFDNVGKVFRAVTGAYMVDLKTIPAPLCGYWETEVESILASRPLTTLGSGRASILYMESGEGRVSPYVEGAAQGTEDGKKKGTILLFPKTGNAQLYVITHLNYDTKAQFLIIHASRKGATGTLESETGITVMVTLAKSAYDYGRTLFHVTLADKSKITFGGVGAFSPLVFDLSHADVLIANQR